MQWQAPNHSVNQLHETMKGHATMALLDFSGIRKMLQNVEGRLADLRNELIDLRKQRAALHYAPLTSEAVRGMLSQWQQDAMSPDLQKQIVAAIAIFARTARSGANGAPLKDLLANSANDLLRASMAQQLGAELNKLVAMVDWPEGAISDTERTERMRTLDKRIADLASEEDQILAGAQSAGLNLE